MGFWLALQPVAVHVFALQRTSSGHTDSGRLLTRTVQGACPRCGVPLRLLPAPSRRPPRFSMLTEWSPPHPALPRAHGTRLSEPTASFGPGSMVFPWSQGPRTGGLPDPLLGCKDPTQGCPDPPSGCEDPPWGPLIHRLSVKTPHGVP